MGGNELPGTPWAALNRTVLEQILESAVPDDYRCRMDVDVEQRTTDETLAGLATSGIDDIADYYDQWAAGYNRDLTDWGYDAYAVAVEHLKAHGVDHNAPILDAGCGTGLVGRRLQAEGFTTVTGVDVSEQSLKLARAEGHYVDVLQVDLTQPPLPFDDDCFSALLCVGVLSYVSDVDGVSREFARVVAPGGAVSLTQRSDLFVTRSTSEVWRTLADEGLWEVLDITDRRPYLPGNREFDGIDVHYGVFRVNG